MSTMKKASSIKFGEQLEKKVIFIADFFNTAVWLFWLLNYDS